MIKLKLNQSEQSLKKEIWLPYIPKFVDFKNNQKEPLFFYDDLLDFKSGSKEQMSKYQCKSIYKTVKAIAKYPKLKIVKLIGKRNLNFFGISSDGTIYVAENSILHRLIKDLDKLDELAKICEECQQDYSKIEFELDEAEENSKEADKEKYNIYKQRLYDAAEELFKLFNNKAKIVNTSFSDHIYQLDFVVEEYASNPITINLIGSIDYFIFENNIVANLSLVILNNLESRITLQSKFDIQNKTWTKFFIK